ARPRFARPRNDRLDLCLEPRSRSLLTGGPDELAPGRRVFLATSVQRGPGAEDELVGPTLFVQDDQRRELGRQRAEAGPQLGGGGLHGQSLQMFDLEACVLEHLVDAVPGEKPEMPFVEETEGPVGKAADQ